MTLTRSGHVLLTGATGFVGQAALERILADRPETRVSVLIRPRGAVSGDQRLAGLARKPVFRALRERIGYEGVAAALAERVRAVEGDLADGLPDLPPDIDTVIHCAGTVSFDPTVDEAFDINVLGTSNLFRAVVKQIPNAHVVHVSTAYVSAMFKGVAPEESLTHSVDWRTEAEFAALARAEAEQASRVPETLGALLERARAEHGKAGPAAVAEAAEKARREWVDDRLVRTGRVRARSLGFTDAYTFTKALGERVAEYYAAQAGLAVSVVRPSIIQSALQRPYPGWFDSYKMMDPIILGYGRGELPEFPGRADSVVDVVPVDMVVAATLAVAERPPERGAPRYYHVSSGARNPLSRQAMDDNVREYFDEHPLPDGDRGHHRVPTWTFPGADQVERNLRAGERALALADRALRKMPNCERSRQWMDKVHGATRKTGALRELFVLYGCYGEVDAVYDDTNLLALAAQTPLAGPDDPGFDAAAIDWRHYLQDVHCPAITAMSRSAAAARAKPAAAATGPRRSPALRTGTDIAAVFDLEGTIVSSNMIESYLWAVLADQPRSAWAKQVASLATSAPAYLRTERHDRADFIRAFMRRYEGADEVRLRRLVSGRLGEALLARAHPEAIRRVREHRAAGHRTVLITGAAGLLVEPLRPLFDEVAAADLAADPTGRLSGHLDAPPLVGQARAAWVRRYAATAGIDLKRSWAYGDSFSDRPLLEAVGNPVAVNPDARLYRFASDKKWRVEDWGSNTQSRMAGFRTVLRGGPAPLGRGRA